MGRRVAMIVCSCNVLSDHDVRTALNHVETPRTPRQVYGCLGCSAQCGRCARTIRRIMNEALAACAPKTFDAANSEFVAYEPETCATETDVPTPCGPNCHCCPGGEHR